MKDNSLAKRITYIVFSIIIVSCFTILVAKGETAYVYAIYLEKNWIKKNPKTKNELEKYLHLYSLHKIEPKKSIWGNSYKLKTGERMMQYRILWNKNCPLDVVYDSENNIKSIYTSYE